MKRQHPPGLPAPVVPPSDSSRPIPLGDAATDQAKVAAQDAGANAVAAKDAAVEVANADTAAYNAILAHFNAVKDDMPPAERSACQSAIQQMATLQATESNQCAAALGYIVSGNSKFAEADAMPANPAPPKTQKFNDAKNLYNAAPPCCVTVHNAHAQFSPLETEANTYLVNYPPP